MPVDAAGQPVEIRRSARRTRSVSAFLEGGRTVVVVPARLRPAEEQQWVDHVLGKLAARQARRRPADADLTARAQRLRGQYLPHVPAPASIAWSDRQLRRWGSCSPADASIRLSRRLRGVPSYVLDYVLVHELAHLVHGGHGPDFWDLVSSYPHTERARGYLQAVSDLDAEAPAAGES